MTECDSGAETERWEVQTECLPRGLGWPKVSRHTAQCVTSRFVNNVASYFWRMGASTLVAQAYFLLLYVACWLCVSQTHIWVHSATQTVLLKYMFISQN